MLRKAFADAVPGVINISDIEKPTTKQSRLTKQQLIRSKAVYYGIGRHLKQTFDDYVYQYELDVVPERELQTWEIMNACYLEMLERHPESSDRDKGDYFKMLVALSVGLNLQDVHLKEAMVAEIVVLWKENFYEF